MIEWTLKGAVVLAAAAVALRLSSAAPAALRRAVLAAAVVGTLALPLVPRWWPAWGAGTTLGVAENSHPITGETAVPAPAGWLAASAPVEAPVDSPSGAPWWLLAWAAGAVLLLARLAADHRRAAALRARAVPGPDGLLWSDEIDTPMVVGLLRPSILMPASAADEPAARRAACLAHERAHLAGHDTRLLFLADVLRALRWFDPLAWWAARRLRAECELTADDAALARGARPSEYAALLLSYPTLTATVTYPQATRLATRWESM